MHWILVNQRENIVEMNLLRLLTLIVVSYCLECFRVKSLNKIRRDTFKLVIEDNQHRADEYNLVRRASSVTTLVIDEHEDVDDENVKVGNFCLDFLLMVDDHPFLSTYRHQTSFMKTQTATLP